MMRKRMKCTAMYTMRQLYVYIMSSSSRTLYVGVTNDIRRRVLQHRQGKGKFTSRYRINRLVLLRADRASDCRDHT